MNRSLNSSGQTSADCSVRRESERPAASRSALGRALTSGRRLRATQPVNPSPVLDRDLLDDLRVGARREAAAQRFGLLVVEEQRGARERHEVAQLRGDERHRVATRRGWCPSPARFRRARRFRGARARCRRRRSSCRLGREAGRRPAHRVGSASSGDAARRIACSSVAASRCSAGSSSMNFVDDGRIERLARFLLQQADRGVEAHRLVIRPLGHQRVEVVDDRQDARAERNLLALQARRIALAVPALVMAQDERRDRIRERHRADDVGADLRVGADLLELFGRQRARLREDVLGHGELADVVQQRRRLHALDLVLRHAERARERRRVELHAADVRLRGLILRVDRERQRFDRRQVQVRHLAHVPLLVVDAAQVDLVGAIGQVERRGRERRQPVRRQPDDHPAPSAAAPAPTK